MQCRMDKRVIELLQAQGAAVTWEQFREAYAIRQKERDQVRAEKEARRIELANDPEYQRKRREERERLDRAIAQIEAWRHEA